MAAPAIEAMSQEPAVANAPPIAVPAATADFATIAMPAIEQAPHIRQTAQTDTSPVQAPPIDEAVKKDADSEEDSEEDAATEAAELLVESREKENGAMAKNRMSQELHANSTLVARQAMSRAVDKAKAAARAESGLLMEKIVNFEKQAEAAEIQAAVLRAKARAELQTATLANL